MSLIPFPDVPNLPGVPQMNRANNAVNTLTLVGRSLAAIISSLSGSAWGIFDTSNAIVVQPQSIYAFDFRADWNTPDYTVQEGSFASYNKVTKPFETSVRLLQAGSLQDRQAMLNALEAIAGDTNKYNIHTPEKSYLSVNILRVEFLRRSNEGFAFLEVDVYFRQIREVSGEYSNPVTANAANPAAIPSTSLGNQQPGTVVPPQASTAAAAALSSAPL